MVAIATWDEVEAKWGFTKGISYSCDLGGAARTRSYIQSIGQVSDECQVGPCWAMGKYRWGHEHGNHGRGQTCTILIQDGGPLIKLEC